MKKKRMINIVVFILLLIGSIIVIFPILWTFITSLKTDVQMFAIPPDLLPDPVTLGHYIEVITEDNFLSYLRNSVLVAFVSCAVSMVAGIPAAYGFAKYTGKTMKRYSEQ